ncbi:NAD(P)-binding domain-containing protein [Mesorhizobium sp.]|nr:NAD(P)-binding domain-containing protein [Mesorhizobium sp.]
MKLSISVVGTGRMGSALARALLRSGYRTTVWNRTKQKAEPLATLGATVAGSVLEAVNAAEIVIVNVSDYQATAAVLHDDAVASAIRGKLVVELTSGTPHGAREAAECLPSTEPAISMAQSWPRRISSAQMPGRY